MFVWISFLVAGVLLAATGYWWRQQRAPVRLLMMAAGVGLLFVAWWRYEVWATQNRIETAVFTPAPRPQRNLQTVFDEVPPAPETAALEPADDAAPFFPPAQDNPFDPVDQRDGAADGEPFARSGDDSEAGGQAAVAERRPQPASPPPEAAPKPTPKPSPKPSGSGRSPAVEAPSARTAPPPEPASRPAFGRWRSSEEIIAATRPAEPAERRRLPPPAPMESACDGASRIDGGICVVIRDELGGDQHYEHLQLFIEGRPVGQLRVDPARPRDRLPIRFTHPGRFGYRIVGETVDRRGRLSINSQGVLVARDGYVYEVRMVPGEARVFLEPVARGQDDGRYPR